MALAKRRVLVLNKTWSPVGVISAQRAIAMLFATYAATREHPQGQPKALVVDPDNYSTFNWSDWSELKPENDKDVIRSAKKAFRIPEVIVLTRYDKLPTHKVTFSRRTIYKRDGFTCQYCGATPGSEELTIDHVTPRSKGGQTTWMNCVLACLKCNTKKADKTLRECGMKLLREPFKPKYQLFKDGGVLCKSWKKFISEVYWSIEMQNDNSEDE
jgi:5-methylcytosine-specific restriction endonuclease McrA